MANRKWAWVQHKWHLEIPNSKINENFQIEFRNPNSKNKIRNLNSQTIFMHIILVFCFFTKFCAPRFKRFSRAQFFTISFFEGQNNHDIDVIEKISAGLQHFGSSETSFILLSLSHAISHWTLWCYITPLLPLKLLNTVPNLCSFAKPTSSIFATTWFVMKTAMQNFSPLWSTVSKTVPSEPVPRPVLRDHYSSSCKSDEITNNYQRISILWRYSHRNL